MGCRKSFFHVILRNNNKGDEFMNLTIRYLKRMLILFIIFGFVPLSFAEYYKYTDENGNIHYTDDFSKVPVKKRKDIETYQETKYPSQTPAAKKPSQEGEKTASNPSPEEEYARFQEKRNQLVEEQKSLEAEFQALTEERDELENQKQQRLLRPQAVELENKIDALNQKIAEFDQKRNAFDEKAKTFNEEIESSNKEKETAPSQ